MGVVHLAEGHMMEQRFTTKEMARMLLQLLDGGSNVLVDDAEYIGQGIHKIYLERDTLVRYAELDD
jgi:hypothetical protein